MVLDALNFKATILCHRSLRLSVLSAHACTGRTLRGERVRAAQVAAGQVSAAIDDQGVAYVWGEHEVLSHSERPDQGKHIPLSIKWIHQRVQVKKGPRVQRLAGVG